MQLCALCEFMLVLFLNAISSHYYCFTVPLEPENKTLSSLTMHCKIQPIETSICANDLQHPFNGLNHPQRMPK